MEERKTVIVTGIEIPFGDLVLTLIKLAIAVIPATAILFVVSFIAWSLLAVLATAPR